MFLDLLDQPRGMVELYILLINSQHFLAMHIILYYLVRDDSLAEEIDIDCYEVLLGVEGKDVSAIIEAVGDLRNLDVFELAC